MTKVINASYPPNLCTINTICRNPMNENHSLLELGSTFSKEKRELRICYIFTALFESGYLGVCLY